MSHIRWLKTLDIISKLEYPRDRLVECYFWALALFYEPHFSISRIVITKVLTMISIIDDTCDSDFDIFTMAVQRWNYSEIDQLPEYMKLIYKMLLDLFDDFTEQFKTREDIKFLIENHMKKSKSRRSLYYNVYDIWCWSSLVNLNPEYAMFWFVKYLWKKTIERTLSSCWRGRRNIVLGTISS
ncbi:hypothetical protein LIER_03133 [Lithospermum erythrorhizon]|uniref:Terpene synthase metal-binding domain-containing protein n=1 Tax=Lithospermum erythrorhizon TaxID=34254 RepID=A0AAV3NVY1_LITER